MPSIGLDPAKFGTNSLRRTKAVLIYRRTGNLQAVQLLLVLTVNAIPWSPNAAIRFSDEAAKQMRSNIFQRI